MGSKKTSLGFLIFLFPPSEAGRKEEPPAAPAVRPERRLGLEDEPTGRIASGGGRGSAPTQHFKNDIWRHGQDRRGAWEVY